MRLPPPEAESEGPNLTPVVDVVFLLLIFFLVATRFDEEEREIGTRLPEVPEAQPLTISPNEVVINIDHKGKYRVSRKLYSEEELAKMLDLVASKNPHYGERQKVQIRADKRVQLIFPARVMSLCEKRKFDHYIRVLPQHR